MPIIIDSDEKGKPQVDFPIGNRRERKRVGESALENSLAQAKKMSRALLKQRNNLTLQMNLRRLLSSINRALQRALSRGIADPWKKAYLNCLIARENFLEYTILPKSKRRDSFDDMLSTVMIAFESCGPNTLNGGHPIQEYACLEIATKLLIEAGRVKEALPLSRKLSISGKGNADGDSSLAVKYHMAVIQLYLLGSPGVQLEPGFLRRRVEVYSGFGETEDNLLREHVRLFEQLMLSGDEFDSSTGFEDWPEEMGA